MNKIINCSFFVIVLVIRSHTHTQIIISLDFAFFLLTNVTKRNLMSRCDVLSGGEKKGASPRCVSGTLNFSDKNHNGCIFFRHYDKPDCLIQIHSQVYLNINVM